MFIHLERKSVVNRNLLQILKNKFSLTELVFSRIESIYYTLVLIESFGIYMRENRGHDLIVHIW